MVRIAALGLLVGCGPVVPSESDDHSGDGTAAEPEADVPAEPADPPPSPCEAGGPIALVEGELAVADFAIVGDRIYWGEGYFGGEVNWADLGAPDTWHALSRYEHAVHALVADADAVYWTTNGNAIPGGGLYRASVEQEKEVLHADLLRPMDVVLDDGWLYYVEGDTQYDPTAGKVHRVPAAGGPPQLLAEGLAHPWAIETDAAFAYWCDFHGSSVARVPKAGGVSEVLNAELNRPSGLALDGTHAYLETDDGIFRVPLAGGDAERVSSVISRGLAVDGTHVYWTTHAYDEPGYAPGTLLRTQKDGTGPVEAVAGITDAGNIKVDNEAIYWTTDSAIMAACKR